MIACCLASAILDGSVSSLPSSGRLTSCSLSLGTLGREGGVNEGCIDGRSSASRRLANMSCSLDRLGPEHSGGGNKSVMKGEEGRHGQGEEEMW